MKTKLFIATLCLCSLTNTSETNAQITGSFSKTFTFNSQSRTLYYFVPTTYNSSNQYKLVVGLHGCGGTGSGFRNEIKFLSDSLNAIIVCPQGLSANNGFMGNASDITFIKAAIDTTVKNYTIDLSHVYLTGFSCNGYTTASMGLLKKYPFRGIVPFNPALLASDFTDGSFSYTKNVPACICAGTADPGYGLDQRLRDSLLAHNASVLFNSMPGIGHTTSFPAFKQEMMECFNYFTTVSGMVENNYFSPLNVHVYPNPASGNITVTGSERINAIEIYNMMGEKVARLQLPPSGLPAGQAGGGGAFDLSSQPGGVYFLQIKTERGTINKKIIIQK